MQVTLDLFENLNSEENQYREHLKDHIDSLKGNKNKMWSLKQSALEIKSGID